MDLTNFRYPGEFEPQSDVFVTWIPDYCGGEGDDDPRKVCADIVKTLLGHVNVHVNCGCQTSMERCKDYLGAAGVDVTDSTEGVLRNVSTEGAPEGAFSKEVQFHQFKGWNFYVRDNGPNIMVDGEGGAVHINPRWNNYSMNGKYEPSQQLDREMGAHMAVELECYNIVSSEMVSEGGDREFNGRGVMIAIEETECRRRNPEYTKEQVEEEYKRIYNLEKIIWLPQPLCQDDTVTKGPLDKLEDGTLVWPSSLAAHADEYCRFVGPKTILLAEVTDEEAQASPVNAENKRRIDAAYEILKAATDVDGEPFEIVRMPCPELMTCRLPQDDPIVAGWKQFFDENGGAADDGTPFPEGDYCFFVAISYCNFLVCNDLVIGQRYWRPGLDEKIRKKDERARAVFEGLFPERTVVMVDAFGLNLTGGGVHCWTKNVAKR